MARLRRDLRLTRSWHISRQWSPPDTATGGGASSALTPSRGYTIMRHGYQRTQVTYMVPAVLHRAAPPAAAHVRGIARLLRGGATVRQRGCRLRLHGGFVPRPLPPVPPV